MNAHMYRGRLLRLAVELYYNELVQDHFHMQWFLMNKDGFCGHNIDNLLEFIIDRKPIHVCGTAACALGWAPVLLNASASEMARYVMGEKKFNWFKFSEEYLGVGTYDAAWDWMFSSEWEAFDNTPQGAAARILMFLHTGGYIEETLCYVTEELFDENLDPNEFDGQRQEYERELTPYKRWLKSFGYHNKTEEKWDGAVNYPQ